MAKIKNRKTAAEWALRWKNWFLTFCICVCGLLGGGFYLLAAALFRDTPVLDWLLCAIGYPAVIFGFWGGVLWLYRNTGP